MRLRLRESLLQVLLRLLHAADRRRPDAAELGTPAIARILAVSNTAIGDTLLSTPGLRSLRLAYPKARISLLVNAAYSELFAGLEDVDELIPAGRGWRGFWSLVRGLRRRHFDLACIFHGNEPQATPLCYLSGARFIFKLPNASRFRYLLSNREPLRPWNDFGHGIDQRLAVAALAGGQPTDRRMTLPVGAERHRQVQAWLAACGVAIDTPLIGFQPGASTLSRRWAPARFAELGRQLLADRPEARLVITGSPAEAALARRIATAIGDARVLVSADALPLPQLPALLMRCALLVTGDTGPMHLAVAVGTPVVALFAVADWRKSGPAYDLERHAIIQRERTCDPCYSKRCPYAEPVCMEQIGVDAVKHEVDRLLARPQA